MKTKTIAFLFLLLFVSTARPVYIEPFPDRVNDIAVTGNLTMADTTSDDAGIIYKSADRFIHNFHHPTGNTAVPEGKNVFVGLNAGNFTMGSTATLTAHGSSNNAMGYEALLFNTTGYLNNAIGCNALRANTTGYLNNAMGVDSLAFNTTGIRNTAVGSSAGQRVTTGSSNIFLGRAAGYRQTTASYLLIIDSLGRADIATEATNAIIYGTMAADPCDQTLKVNAVLNVTENADVVGILDVNDVTVNGASTVSVVLTFAGGGSSDCNSITITSGLITDYTTVP